MAKRNHKSQITAALLTVLAALTASACTRSTLMHSYCSIPVSGWEQSDRLTYDLDTVRDGGTYSVSLGVRTTSGYPYQKLWLAVDAELHSPDTTYTDTLVCSFVKSDGTRNGKGTDTYQYDFDFGTIDLKKGQSGRFTVHHIMQKEILPGVSDIGIKLYR